MTPTRRSLLLALAALPLAACAPTTLRLPTFGGFGRPAEPQLGPDGQPIPVAYTITEREGQAIPARVLGEVNRLRANTGAAPLALSPQLSTAAAAHSRDMAGQNRAWHWGSDGSSPAERAQRQGFLGQVVGENISESYENDIATLSAWMNERDTRDVIMDPSATQLGIAWYQENTKKIWWTLITGR